MFAQLVRADTGMVCYAVAVAQVGVQEKSFFRVTVLKSSLKRMRAGQAADS